MFHLEIHHTQLQQGTGAHVCWYARVKASVNTHTHTHTHTDTFSALSDGVSLEHGGQHGDREQYADFLLSFLCVQRSAA